MTDTIQFDRVETTGPGGGWDVLCKQCRQRIETVYYVVNRHVICESCRMKIQNAVQPSSTRWVPAMIKGFGAALVGAAIYYGVLVLTGYQIGLIAVLVGYLVGKAVRQGSGGLGGPRYQILAVALTYFSIVLTYLPIFYRVLWTAVLNHQWYFFIRIVGNMVSWPTVHGIRSVTGLFIIGVALWEAWRLNQAVNIRIEGPFKVGDVKAPT